MADTKDLVKRQYGAHAEGYVTSAVHAQGESLKRLVELVQPQKDWRALDISTGGGHTALAFHPPFLYAGYVGLSIAFSFAIAALIEGRIDAAWARWVRPW